MKTHQLMEIVIGKLRAKGYTEARVKVGYDRAMNPAVYITAGPGVAGIGQPLAQYVFGLTHKAALELASQWVDLLPEVKP